MFRHLFISLLALVGATLGGAVTGPGTAWAQASDIDLAVSIALQDDVQNPTITVANYGSDDAYHVQVVMEVDGVTLGSTLGRPPAGTVALHPDHSTTTLIWSLPQMPGKGTEYEHELRTASSSTRTIVQYTATVHSGVALEPEALQHNNHAEAWQIRISSSQTETPNPAYAIEGTVDNRFPQSQGSVTFTIVAKNSRTTGDRGHLSDAQVDISLPAGLTYASHTAPTGTSYNSSTGIWTIGNWQLATPVTHSLTLTATLAANAVLNEQCVTAELSAKPPEPIDRTANNRSTVCLGAPPDEPRLFQNGDVELWTPYPCVGKTTHPCTTADTVEVVTAATIEKWGSGQIIKSSPEEVNVFIQVDPTDGRTVDTHAHSVSTVSWQTARDAHSETSNKAVPGVQIGFVRKHLKVADWENIIRTVSVSGVIAPTASDQTCDSGDPSPPCGPGRMKIRSATSRNTFFDPNPSHERSPFNPSSDSDTFFKYFAEFATLGTYVVDFEAQVTNKNTTTYPNPFSGTTRSIFHVGPIAELAVHDAGPSSQRAFTIVAVNNGPDAAPAAQVTVDLQGATVSQAIASRGSYDDGVWTLGTFPGGAPTLTLITTAPVDTEITATITNTQDYAVCIDSSGNDVDVASESACTGTTGNTWHTAKYYDYISDNNEATVTAQPGTASQAPTAAITVEWTAQPGASTYQIWRQGSPWELLAEVSPSQTRYTDNTAVLGQAYTYAVRALDAQGFPVSTQTAAIPATAPEVVVVTGGDVTSGDTAVVRDIRFVFRDVSPTGPHRVRATADGPSRIDLVWSGPQTLYNRAVASYELEVSLDQEHWSTLEPYLELFPPRYTHTGLQPATTYYYRVYAHNAKGRSLASDVVSATTAEPRVLTGYLENPAPGSFQSGVGVIHGWECEAEEVVVQVNGTPSPAVYGTPRPDTLGPCGDTDNGFELLLNWNALGDGEHDVVVEVDGTELGRATVTVTTLGAPFVSGLSGTCEATDFPIPDESVTLVWQEARQNFVITDGRTPPTFSSTGSGAVPGFLENPAPNTFQSGIGPLTGWVCEAEEVVLKINGQSYPVPYGLERPDTQGPCGDTDNGFGTVFNWNELGSGEHEVEAVADGVVLDRATVWVQTLGEEFVRDVVGTCEVPDFPAAGDTATLTWQEAQQNFVITAVE